MPSPPVSPRYGILLELLRTGPLRASDLVGPTELTLQGVSYHLKQMEADGLVAPDDDGRRVRLTAAGIEALHDHFLGLKAFVDLALAEMLPVEECVALAAEDFLADAEVGLFMERGRLIARAGESPSRGRVRRPARRGDVVVVTGLTGVVQLVPGTVHVVRLPPPARLPDPPALGAFVRAQRLRWDVLAASGLEAEVWVERASLGSAAAPITFAPVAVARSAAEVGLDVLLVASWDHARPVVESLGEAAGTGASRITVKVHELPPA